MFPHVHVLEFMFATLAVLGMALCLWGVATTAKDSKVVAIQRKNSPLQIATLNRLYQETFRLAIHAVMLVLAGIFVHTPPPPPDYTMATQSLAGMVGWIVVALLLMMKEALDRRERILLDRLYANYYGRRDVDFDPPHSGRRRSDHTLPPEDGLAE